MVIVPGLSHLAVLAISLISNKHKVIVVDNGHKNEITILKKFLPNVSIFKIKRIVCLDNK